MYMNDLFYKMAWVLHGETCVYTALHFSISCSSVKYNLDKRLTHCHIVIISSCYDKSFKVKSKHVRHAHVTVRQTLR